MGVGPESTFKSWLVKDGGKYCFFQTIETNTSSGVPDVFFSIDGKSGWMELKATRQRGICYMRVSQYNWFRRYHKQKGIGLLLIKRVSTPHTIDVYLTESLAKIPPDMCKLRDKNVIFPSAVEPDLTYTMGSGVGRFIDKIHGLIDIDYKRRKLLCKEL